MNFAKADTSGVSYFPSNQTNPGFDYGRATFDVHNRFLLGGNIQAPYGISISPMMVADSGSPFNITIGEDINGDNQYNDRPALATSSSTSTLKTTYGTFDLNPAWNQNRIAYNSGSASRSASAPELQGHRVLIPVVLVVVALAAADRLLAAVALAVVAAAALDPAV